MRLSLFKHGFALVILLVGLGYVVLTPPFDAPDETNHFLKAWSVSEGHFILQPTDDHRIGDTLPRSLGILCQYFRPEGHAPPNQMGWGDIGSMSRLPLHARQRQFIDLANTGMYAPIAYLPGAGVIRVMRWLDMPPLFSLYAVRLLHLLTWLWVLSAIGRMAGERRWLFLYAGLLPGILVFQSSANPDAFIHAGIWWLIAVCHCGIRNSRSTWSAGLMLLLASVQKLIFIPLGLLFSRTGSWKAASLWTIIALTGAMAWGNRAAKTFIPYDQYHREYRDGQTLNPGVDPSAQGEFVLRHPLKFLNTAGTGIVRSAPATIAHLVGKYGWDKQYMPGWVMGLVWIGFLLIMMGTPNELSPGERIKYLAISCAIILLFSLTNYLLWDPVGQNRMDNFQGRYFIGLLPLVVLAVGGKYILRIRLHKTSQILLIFGHLYMIHLLIRGLSGHI